MVLVAPPGPTKKSTLKGTVSLISENFAKWLASVVRPCSTSYLNFNFSATSFF